MVAALLDDLDPKSFVDNALSSAVDDALLEIKRRVQSVKDLRLTADVVHDFAIECAGSVATERGLALNTTFFDELISRTLSEVV